MRILLTNDDGIEASGIKILAEKLEENGHEIIVVAPSHEQSATSHSITLHQPLRIHQFGKNKYAATGTPTDCVTLASQIILQEKVDLVISGINSGQNMGEDILYSGTVAAALESMFLGFKAIAISLAAFEKQKFETAAHYINILLQNNIVDMIGNQEILNINIPNLTINEVKGIKITKLGHRKYQDFVVEQKDPRGEKIYWIGGDKPKWSQGKNDDCKVLQDGYISITPIRPNFTNEISCEKLKIWQKKINIK